MSILSIPEKDREPWMPKDSDYDNGIDHYYDCDDPWNCNCASLMTCPSCCGTGSNFGKGSIDDVCTKCDGDGLIIKADA